MLSKSTHLQVIYFCWQIQVSFEQNIANGNSEKNPEDLELNELDELEDELDERAFLAYRQKRIAEMTANQKLSRFGEVVEITGKDYVHSVHLLTWAVSQSTSIREVLQSFRFENMRYFTGWFR